MKEELLIKWANITDWIPVPIQAYPNTDPLILRNGLKVLTGCSFDVYLRPKNFSNFVAALFLCQALRERGCSGRHLIVPCLPGMRQDRLNDDGDILFTAKSVAMMINDCYFDQVHTLDAHSEAIVGLIDNCENVPSALYMPDMSKYKAIVSPDGGAEKRAGKVAQRFQLPLIHAWKSRDVTTGKISGFGFENRMDINLEAPVLFIDDICDGGGTFLGLATEMKAAGFKNLNLFVSHGYFTKGVPPLLEHFNKVITTDSIIRDHIDGLDVVTLPMHQEI